MSSRGQQPSTKDIIGYLLERPTEPIFTRKGGNGSVKINVPERYYTDRYRRIIEEVESNQQQAASVNVNIKNLTTLPDLSVAEAFPLNKDFSLFNDYDRNCATRLIDIFLEPRSVDDLLSTAAYARDRVNPHMFAYALSVALLHRPDTRNIEIPLNVQSFPSLYIDNAVFVQAREEENIVPDGSRQVIDVPRDYTATDLDMEHKVAYFREDIGVNLHHFHWRLVYPISGSEQVTRKDRRGELFYYMHQQIIARYNADRLSNQLPRVKRFLDFREPIIEGYFPKLNSIVASRTWPPRPANSYWRNINRETDQLRIDIQDLERWRDRIFEAIHTGSYLPSGNGPPVPFTIETGIDVLGNMVESNIMSVNRTEYGNLHNSGHLMIAYCHDPENQYLESMGVMANPSTAMRDPLFYRWHCFINDIFEDYKSTLPPYTVQDLQFDGIRVAGIQITSTGYPNNVIGTFWQQAELDLSRGLDFAESRGRIYARVTHLQHAPFNYNIVVENSSNSVRQATVRIFYAPKFSESHTPYLLRDQKSLFIELDRFVVNLQRGRNNLTRRSVQSSVTIPYEQTFRDLSNRPTTPAGEEAFNFCGCGWPHHLLICKGTLGGFQCELFVMITDYRIDSVNNSSAPNSACDDASSFCGIRDGLYPDRRHMGYPFDRLPRAGVATLRQFLTPNMAVQDIVVMFRDRTVAPTQQTTVAQTPAQTPARRP